MPLARDGDAAMLTEDLPDGAGGLRQTEAKRLKLRIMRKVIQDGFGTGDALEMSRRRITNGEDALDDERVEARGRPGARARTAVQDAGILGRGVTETLAPFLDPSEGTMGGSSVIEEGPGRLELEQRAEKGTVGQPAVFHGATSTNWSWG
ncbi:MAG TPA: hypothetical protein VLA19_04090 [Herpetosiphonaceae bacterium]|nr:hypothetical protein [Herpetosiphonaceae bacterium]